MKRIFGIVATTWAFWFVVSLWNFGFLGGIAFWPLMLLIPEFYLKYLDFLQIPIANGAAGAFVAAITMRMIARPAPIHMQVVAVNLAFLVGFLVSAEIRKDQLIVSTLETVDPECFGGRWFIYSLAIAGEEYQFDVHAVYRKNGEFFLWSYRDQAFFSVPQTTYQNLDLLGCEIPGQKRISN